MSDTFNNPMNTADFNDLEAAIMTNMTNAFEDVFDISPPLPSWASAPANGEWVPSTQLLTIDGRLTGNAVLMWWEIRQSLPVAVVVTDAGNVMHLSYNELPQYFYAPKYLMRDPLYAHLTGIVAADIEIPEEFRFLFEKGGVPLDEEDEFGDYLDEYFEDEFVDLDVINNNSYDISIIDSDGDTMMASFDSIEEMNEFLKLKGVPFQL